MKIGVVHATSAAGIYYALEKGYFAEQGITLEMTGMRNMVDMVAPLTTGDLDIGAGGVASGVFNAFERDIGLRLIAGYIVYVVGDRFSMWLVRKDLAGQVKDYADLKGKKVATSAKGTVGEMGMHFALARGGLSINDAEHVELGFGDAIAALANKGIDVASSIEPFITQAVSQGIAQTWKSTSEVVPDYQAGIFVASPKFMAEKRDVANRFMVAYLQGARGYTDVFFKNKGGREGGLAALAKYSGIKDQVLLEKMAPVYIEPNSSVYTKNLTEQMEWYIKVGYVKTRVSLERLVDTGPTDYAVKILGKYQ